MAKKPDTKKHLEALLGYELSEDAAQLINPFLLVALTTVQRGGTTARPLTDVAPNRCDQSVIADVSGIARTGSNGQSQFRLTDFLCPATSLRFSHPLHVVATPLSSTPCFLTLLHSIVSNGADVEIKVFSWDADGVAAPNVIFDWRCRVTLGTGSV